MILLLCAKSTFIRAEAFDREIKEGFFSSPLRRVQVNNYEIVVNFFHISHNLT